jgi:hypothetical protein
VRPAGAVARLAAVTVIDGEGLGTAAHRLAVAADELRDEAARVTRALQQLDWRSPTGRAFRDAAADAVGRVGRRADDLAGLAVEVRARGSLLQRAEARACGAVADVGHAVAGLVRRL